MSARELPPANRPPTSVGDATERLAAIVEAAEQAASTVIDDAEKQARQTLEEAQARADRMVAERLRALADELDPGRDGDRPLLKPVESADPEPEPTSEPAGPRRSSSAGARLLATQMAVSGASREEIEERLRRGFEIEDTSEILDAILGPEG
jgi:hypothetical protein